MVGQQRRKAASRPSLAVDSPETQAAVRHFCELVFHLRMVHWTYHELFAGERSRRLLEHTAHRFFLDLQGVLGEHILLAIAKLTDNASDATGKRENFTIRNLLEGAAWQNDTRDAVGEDLRLLAEFRRRILPARHRLLAHLDKTALLSNDSLGAFPEGDDERALNSLEHVADVFHKASFGETFGDMVPSHPGDVLALKRVLARGLAFDRLAASSDAATRRQLHECVAAVAQSLKEAPDRS